MSNFIPGRRRVVALVLVAGLTTALFLALARPAGASDHHSCIFFPWAPNGVEIDDPVTGETAGPFYGQITIQNLEDVPISAVVMPHQDCNTDEHGGHHTVSLQPMQFVTLDAGNIAGYSIPDGTGGPLVVSARIQGDTSKLARIAAVQRQVSPAKTFFPGRTTGIHLTSSGYTGLIEDAGIGPTIYLPIAQTNTNWNTLIRVSNFDTSFGTQVELNLYEAGSGDALGPYQLPLFQGETATFDLRALGVPPEWVGSAVLTADPERAIGAVAERIKVETNMLLMNASQTEVEFTETGFAVAPLIFQNWHHWNTGLSVANFWATENDVDVHFYDMDGVLVHSETTTLPPNGMDFFYLPAGDGEPFIGSAIILGTRPLYGAVDEVKYFGDDPDTGHAMSYMLNDGTAALEGDALAFPLYARGNAQTASHDTSGIQIFNVGEGPAEVELMIYGHDGTPALSQPESFTLESFESRTLYALDYTELPANVVQGNFFGSAVVRNVHPGLPGESALIGVMNLVNYDMQYDGSTTYNHTRFSETMICGGNC